MANDDFLTAQLAAMSTLEFVRLWVPREDGTYKLVIEAVREEEPETFSISVPQEIEAEHVVALAEIGIADGRRLLQGVGEEAVAAEIRNVMAIASPQGSKVSLTHGARLETVTRRRVDRMTDGIYGLLQARWPTVARPKYPQVPIPIGVQNVQTWLWPKADQPQDFVEIWALVAQSLPSGPDIDALVAQCNEKFYFGRLLRRDTQVFYRDVVHAEPLNSAPLLASLDIALKIASDYGSQFAKLGAVDATTPIPAVEAEPAKPPADGGTGLYI